MARTTVTLFTSDLTGAEIANHAAIKVTVDGAVYTLDADASEETVQTLVAKGRKSGRPGRKKKA